jgi:CheY-like chemotaxis protein/HPt (histidine-containing phosphotransfer) domain-containing protein
MGGSGIGIESELGRGSAFSFNLSFPRYTAGEERDLIVPERIKGLRALIIEDNEASMKVLGQMLEHFGIRNEGAVTAEEGLALLSSEEGARRFGLVFIDWKLPGMDGLSAAEEIKNSETLKDLTIILMSAFGGEQEISKDGNKVVNGFLHKPIKQSTLFDTIMTAFGYTSRPEGLKYLAASEREFKGIRVLLAEDNKANQQVACEVLFQAGFEVDVANNGREALEALRRREYAVVLMDVQMPVMDGYEATRRIRELEGSSQSSIPIIAITASAMKGDREKCLAAGMDDYISKPINRDELFRVLRKYLKAVGPPADSGLAAGDTAEDHPPLPDLQGIDVSEGLRRLGVSWERFSKLLLRFSGGQTEVFEELRQAVENGDRENVRLLAHSLAGAAGNISATALRKAAKDLEHAAAGDKGGDEAGLPEYSAAMEREFDVVIGSINSLASVDDRTGIKPAPSSRLDLKQLLSYLQKLEPHLKRRYAKESGAIIDEISRLTWPEDLKDNLEELDGLVRKYRLKQAYPVLESIMKRLAEVKGE